MNIVLLQPNANIVMFWKCGLYGIVFIDVFFYNRSHGNVVQGFWHCRIIFMNVCVVIAFTMVKMLRNVGL
jgi:hypothetical protein